MSSQFLSHFKFFSNLDEVELADLALLAKSDYFEPGQIIIEEGSPNDALCLIQQGTVEIIRQEAGNWFQLATLETGGFFGNVTMFYTSNAVATARAVDKVLILKIKHQDLIRYFSERPEAGVKILSEMMKDMSKHLVSANAKLGDLLYWYSISEERSKSA